MTASRQVSTSSTYLRARRGCRRLCAAESFVAGPSRSGRRGLVGAFLVAGRRALLEDLVDQAERLGLVGAEEFVALDRGLDRLDRLAGIFGHQLVHPMADAKDFLGLDL